MKIVNFTCCLMSMLFLSNCSSKVFIKKTSNCTSLQDQKFSPGEIKEIENLLERKLQSTKHTLKNKGFILEVSSKSKDLKKATFFEEYSNRPDLLFKKIKATKIYKDNKVVKALKKIKQFRPYIQDENLFFDSAIIGYVENQNNLIDVNRKLELQNHSLSQENMYWLTNPAYIKGKNFNRYYLLATDTSEAVRMENILNLTKDIKAYYDADNFEPAIKLYLNTCGISEYSKHFKRRYDQLNLYAVIIDNKINSFQRIRIRNDNEISIFGFKKIEEAEALIRIIERNNLSVKIE